MKWIKLFENFDSNIVKNTEDILIDLKNFGFELNINSFSNRITIEIKKSKKEEQRIFFVSDIYHFLEDCDNYLRFGESLKLETVYFETIETSKELENINSLKSERQGILSLFICYTLR